MYMTIEACIKPFGKYYGNTEMQIIETFTRKTKLADDKEQMSTGLRRWAKRSMEVNRELQFTNIVQIQTKRIVISQD
jgi:hypothetical protein